MRFAMKRLCDIASQAGNRVVLPAAAPSLELLAAAKAKLRPMADGSDPCAAVILFPLLDCRACASAPFPFARGTAENQMHLQRSNFLRFSE